MYQYVSKNSTESAKAISSDKEKKVASKRKRIINSSAFRDNRQASGYTIQRLPVTAAIASKTEHRYSADSARNPRSEPPSLFPYVSPNVLQASENRTPKTPPTPTAIAPVADNQYSVGMARFPSNDLSLNFPDDLNFIYKVLSDNDWKDLVKYDMGIRCRAEVILDSWDKFLPEFLSDNDFKPYGANPSLTYHRPGSNCAAESPDNSDEREKSKLEKMYSGSSGIRKRRKYNFNEKIKRYLRHCASALAINFGIKNEIQCYYDNGIVYVATNSNADLNKLSQINNTKISDCADILGTSYKETIGHTAENDNTTIWSNFQTQLYKVIFSNKRFNPLLRRLRHALMCPNPLKNAEFKVIEDDYGIEGLHAERKILYHLRTMQKNDDIFLNPLWLGGIRRPCFICSALCFKNMSEVHPGPVWVSNAASRPRDINEMFLILSAIKNKKNITNISLIENSLAMDADTQSEAGSEYEQDTT